jgi:Homeodomain-like domain
MASLSDEFQRRMSERAERAAPSGARAAMDRYGWSAREVAQQFGVSERTARRWRQQDRIPERRRDDWQRATGRAAQARQRARMERRGLSALSVTGIYRISKNKYKATPGAPVRVMPGNKITAAQMREYFGALDAGDAEAADQILNDALGEAYEAPTDFEDAEGVDFTI